MSLQVAIISKAHSEDYFFDPELFQGSAYGQGLEQFNQDTTQAGKYLVDVYLNGKLLKDGIKIEFIKKDKDEIEPCIPYQIVKIISLKRTPKAVDINECKSLKKWIESGSWQFDQSNLKLMLNIPSAEINIKPKGYVDPSQWDDGETALFIRHNTNYNWTESASSGYKYQYFGAELLVVQILVYGKSGIKGISVI